MICQWEKAKKKEPAYYAFLRNFFINTFATTDAAHISAVKSMPIKVIRKTIKIVPSSLLIKLKYKLPDSMFAAAIDKVSSIDRIRRCCHFLMQKNYLPATL